MFTLPVTVIPGDVAGYTPTPGRHVAGDVAGYTPTPGIHTYQV
eukprot:SAG11_NODE_38556_length_251_cov_6.822368_1_plen_42_part_10